MKVTLVTIFPEFFPGPFGDGMIRVAREKGRLDVQVLNLRDFTDDVHKTVDDAPFGGGPGMVMKIEPLDRALGSLEVGTRATRAPGTRVVLTSPQGTRFDQTRANRRSASVSSAFASRSGRRSNVRRSASSRRARAMRA